MDRELLLEIGCEELPAGWLPGLTNQIGEIVDAQLRAHRLPPESPVETYSTPRRLTVRIVRIPERQNDLEELVNGPPVSASFKPDGSPTPAAAGFAVKQGVEVGALERIQFCAERAHAFGKLGRRHAMFARELLDRRQALFHVILAAGVHIKAIQIVLQLARRLADLNARFYDQGRNACKLRIDAGETLQGENRTAHARMRAARILFEELHERGLCAFGQAATVGKTRTLLGQLFELRGRKLQGLKLALLMSQKIDARVAVARAAFQIERAIHDLKPDAMRDADLARQGVEPPEAIEQLTLGGAPHERLKFVLAMNVD